MEFVISFKVLLVVGFRFCSLTSAILLKEILDFCVSALPGVVRRLSTNLLKQTVFFYLLFSQGCDLIDISILCGYVHLQKLDLSVNKIEGM